jgi:hypothetical protein
MKQLTVLYDLLLPSLIDVSLRFVSANPALRRGVVDEIEQLNDHVFVRQLKLELHVHTVRTYECRI